MNGSLRMVSWHNVLLFCACSLKLLTAGALAAGPRWVTGPPLVLPSPDEAHDIVGIKDPTVVHDAGLWHIFATTASRGGAWSMAYLNFRDWAEAPKAKLVHLDQNPNLRGYHCAPQVFYFRPHKKWYLIFQSQQPQYSTSENLADPMSWTQPRDFFHGKPASLGDAGWLDYACIADEKFMYLFFTGDNGKFYRSRTRIQDFPEGMSDPEVVLNEDRKDLFEAGQVYRLGENGSYMAIIEAAGPHWERHFRLFTAKRLDGDWRDEGSTFENPWAGIQNTVFEKGVEPWTTDISHGELLRSGNDEKMIVEPRGMRFLFQGQKSEGGLPYHQLPYRLGLLREAE